MNFFSTFKNEILIKPIKNKPNKIINNPEIKLSCFLKSKKISLKISIEAPIKINTTEKPEINNKIRGNNFSLFMTDESWISEKDFPKIYEMKPGTIGKTHGDKKLKIPAKKAIVSGTFWVINLYIILLK